MNRKLITRDLFEPISGSLPKDPIGATSPPKGEAYFETTGAHSNAGIELRDRFDLDLGPLDATFRDSSKAPLHSWFPYLEGYSPRFVERVRREYLRDATKIIEPFAGSGTTPIVLAQMGVECAYSEANPAMGFIAETKLSVLRLEAQDRQTLVRKLHSIAKRLTQHVQSATPDETLRETYERSFGTSVFFDDEAFDLVLRLRSLADELSTVDGLVGDCFSVAVLSSLIPASRLKRAGDLRYRTEKELALGIPNIVQLVRTRLIAQTVDLANCATLKARSRYACPTAGALHEHLDDSWEGVITSPPYLNGTNYIRNARLELWYLRYIEQNSDLRRLRNLVITSGINDVHAQTRWAPITPSVERVVRNIQQDCYDSRIAKMVGGYFHDMAAMLGSVARCLRPGARVCVDIGDSIYNKIHVPTDDLLVEVAECVGFLTIERVHLRKRVSKGGGAVRQQLLVFETPSN